MSCSLKTRDDVRQFVLEFLGEVTGGEHVAIDDDTKLDGGAEGLGYDSIAVRGWCGSVRKKVKARGCTFGLTPDDFEGFDTVGDMCKAICKDLGIST